MHFSGVRFKSDESRIWTQRWKIYVRAPYVLIIVKVAPKTQHVSTKIVDRRWNKLKCVWTKDVRNLFVVLIRFINMQRPFFDGAMSSDVICRVNSVKGGETQHLPSSEEVVGFLERQIAGKRESFTTQPPHESELFLLFFGVPFLNQTITYKQHVKTYAYQYFWSCLYLA